MEAAPRGGRRGRRAWRPDRERRGTIPGGHRLADVRQVGRGEAEARGPGAAGPGQARTTGGRRRGRRPPGRPPRRPGTSPRRGLGRSPGWNTAAQPHRFEAPKRRKGPPPRNHGGADQSEGPTSPSPGRIARELAWYSRRAPCPPAREGPSMRVERGDGGGSEIPLPATATAAFRLAPETSRAKVCLPGPTGAKLRVCSSWAPTGLPPRVFSAGRFGLTPRLV